MIDDMYLPYLKLVHVYIAPRLLNGSMDKVSKHEVPRRTAF